MEHSQSRRRIVRTHRRQASTAGRGALRLIIVTTIVLGPLTTPSMAAQEPPTSLVIEPPLSAKLEALAEGLHHEIALCLSGTVLGDTATASAFVMPVPRRSTPLGSTFSTCPTETLALWHNHPMPSGKPPVAHHPAARLRSEPITNPLLLCALSQHDIETTVQLGFPFAVIAVGDVSCWWTLDQVRAFEQSGLAPGPRVPSQTADSVAPAAMVAGDRQ